jgi:hypothetical protein
MSNHAITEFYLSPRDALSMALKTPHLVGEAVQFLAMAMRRCIRMPIQNLIDPDVLELLRVAVAALVSTSKQGQLRQTG